MKKILAILLAAIMAFSLGVIGFAEEAAEFPTQTAGQVYIASEKIEVEAGQIYQVPVYIVSDYTASSQGDLVLGFKAAITGDVAQYMNILSISASEDVQALTGYSLIGSDAEQIAFTVTDLSILKQAKLQIATVVIEVSADYVGSTVAEDGETVTPVNASLELEKADFTKYLDNANAILAAATDMAIVNGISVEAIDVEFVSADIVEYVELPWNERLRNWFLTQSDKILTFLVAIFDTLAGLLPTL